MKKRLIAIILCCLMCATLGACGKNNNTTETQKAKTSKKITKEFKPYFKNNVAEMTDVKVEITEVRVIPAGDEGNEYGEKPIIAFWYTATNKSNKDIDPLSAWLSFFTAIQDNDPNIINELEVAPSPDDRFLNTQTEIIKQGGSVQGVWAYILDDETTPVTLVAKRGYENHEIGRINYSITG